MVGREHSPPLTRAAHLQASGPGVNAETHCIPGGEGRVMMADPFTAESVSEVPQPHVPAPGPAPTVHSRETEDMEIPYIPQGTPITVSINGHWDGMHNGNEPYMSYPGPGDTTKKVYIPHGALVQTKPEEVEAVEFTVDKTPRPPEKCLSMWYGYRCGEPQGHSGRHKAPQGFEFGPLTDVTDTGEPLDTEPTYAGQCEHREERRCGRPSGHAPSNEHDYSRIAQWEADLLEEQYTPRKPEPGDRVRVTYEATYQHRHSTNDFSDHVMHDFDRGGQYVAPFDAQITVIEPARPAVPEEPAGLLVVEDKGGAIWVRGDLQSGYDWKPTNQGFDPVCWEDLWVERGPLVSYERGPVIG